MRYPSASSTTTDGSSSRGGGSVGGTISVMTKRVFRQTSMLVISLFLLLNLILFFVNVMFVLRRSGSSSRKNASAVAASNLGDQQPPQLEGDSFEHLLMQEKDKYQKRSMMLEAKVREMEGEIVTLKMKKKKKDDDDDATDPDHHRTALKTDARVSTEDRDGQKRKEGLVVPGDVDTSVAGGGGGTQNQHDALAIPYLIIGIPTIPRPHEMPTATTTIPLSETLLGKTIRSIEREIESYEDDEANSRSTHGVPSGNRVPRVKVVVVNNRPGSHLVFEKLADKMRHKKSNWFEFVENENPRNAPLHQTTAPEFINDQHEKPTERVKRQTLDVASMLDYVIGKSKYFFFTEDDFGFCGGNTLMALEYMIRKANYYQNTPHEPFTAIRCGFGLNGIIMHNRPLLLSSSEREEHQKQQEASANLHIYGDLERFRDYLMEHYARRPPDHLVVEFFAKESGQARSYFGPQRHVMAFRYNVVEHLGGHQSTLREEDAWSTPGCFTELIAPQVFVVEAWNPVDCPTDDIWPCNYPHLMKKNKKSKKSTKGFMESFQIVWNADPESEVSRNRKIYHSD